MAGANRDSFAIENRSDVVRMNAFDYEGQNACFFSRGADQTQSRNPRERCSAVGQKLMLVPCNSVEPDFIHVIESGSERNRSCNIRRARLELMRQHVVSGLLESDRSYHIPAALV